MLDKKEAAAAAAAAAAIIITNGSSGSGGSTGNNNNNSSNNAGISSTAASTQNSNIIIAQTSSLFGQHQTSRNKSFWRDEFSPQISATNENSSSNLSTLYTGNSSVPNLNMFPVGFNLAELTSSLARGSKT